MQIKKDLLSHMGANHPDFKFAWAKSVFYNFCRIHEDGLYDFIFFQRDGKTGALAVEVATSYNPFWAGAGAKPFGRNTGLAYLKFGRSRWIEVELNWYTYNNLKSELAAVLAEISSDLHLHAGNFFLESARQLRSDELLQYGLSLVAEWKPLEESQRLQLIADWQGSQTLIANPIYHGLETALHQFAVDGGHPANNIRSYVFDLLYNFTRPNWSWKNSRI